MNTNTPLFTARVTTDVLPRISVDFGQGNVFQKDGLDGATCMRLAVKAERQIKISLLNKTVMTEAAESLGQAHDSGKSLTLRQASQNTYAYEDDYEEGELGNLSQLTLQVKGSSLVAKFSSGPVPLVTQALPYVKLYEDSSSSSCD